MKSSILTDVHRRGYEKLRTHCNHTESYLTRDGDNIVVRVENEEKFRIPIHNLEGVVCFGYMGASPQLMRLCSEHNVGLSFLSPSGRFQARVHGKIRGNVLLRRAQYRIADNDEQSLDIARSCIIGKIVNCKTVLGRSIRDHGEVIDLKKVRIVDGLLTDSLEKAMSCNSADSLRGIEGNCAKWYFDVFDELILRQKILFLYEKNRRPPLII